MEQQITLSNIPVKKLPKLFEEHEQDKILYALQNPARIRQDDVGLWLKKRNICIFILASCLGTRAKELLCCRLEDLDLKNMLIDIRPESNKIGKGRTLPIPQRAWSYLYEYLTYSRTQYWKFSPYLFPTLQNAQLSSDRWQEIFKEAQILAGTYRHRRASHALRHTALTKAYIKTKDPHVVKVIAGWKSLDMMSVYVHLAANMQGYLEYQREALTN